MPLVETHRGYSIFTATAVTTSRIGDTALAYRVKRPDGSQLGDRPFPSLQAAREAIDEAVDMEEARENEAGEEAGDDDPTFEQRYVLQKGRNGEQDVHDTTYTPSRKIGSIKFNGPGRPHSAFGADGEDLGEHAGGRQAKKAVVDAYLGR